MTAAGSPRAQSAFAAGLLDPAQPVPAGLVAWNGSDVTPRYAVYRNNVAMSLLKALQDTFPATCRVLGAEAFRDLALRFLRTAPPRSPRLAEYGAAFPAFIAECTEVPSSAPPALADLARLEYLRVQAFHAADAMSLSPMQWAAWLARPDDLPGLRLTLQPSVFTLDSPHAVVTLWAAQQAEAFDATNAIGAIDDTRAQSAVILRPDADVLVLAVTPAFTRLLGLLGAGTTLGRAVALAGAADAAFDLDASLALLIRHGFVVAAVASSDRDEPA